MNIHFYKCALRSTLTGIMALALLAMATVPSFAMSAKAKRDYVLNAPQEEVQAIGQHFMFGYHAICNFARCLSAVLSAASS